MIGRVIQKYRDGTLGDAITRRILDQAKSGKGSYAHWHHMTSNQGHWSVQQFAHDFKLVPADFEFDNYFLDKTKLVNSESIIYSVGILTDTGFEEQLVESAGATIHVRSNTCHTHR